METLRDLGEILREAARFSMASFESCGLLVVSGSGLKGLGLELSLRSFGVCVCSVWV